MSSQTTNLHLVKPATTDDVDVADINGNMDTIDTAVHTLQESVSETYTDYEVTTTSAGNAATNLSSAKRIFGVMDNGGVSRIYIPWIGSQSAWLFKVLDAGTMQAVASSTVKFRVYHS